ISGSTSSVGVSVTGTHSNPGSTLQVGEQPSPAVVLPSSHSSLVSPGSLIPSPQAEVHAPWEQSGSFLQNGVQPSPWSLFMSSHRSSPPAPPSPHPARWHGLPPSGQA